MYKASLGCLAASKRTLFFTVMEAIDELDGLVQKWQIKFILENSEVMFRVVGQVRELPAHGRVNEELTTNGIVNRSFKYKG